jgi:hypothetical protein
MTFLTASATRCCRSSSRQRQSEPRTHALSCTHIHTYTHTFSLAFAHRLSLTHTHSLLNRYRSEFDKLKEMRNELDPATQGVAEAKQNLVDEFNRWADSPMAEFAMGLAEVRGRLLSGERKREREGGRERERERG